MPTSLRSKLRKPTHPGAILREDILPSVKLSQAKLATALKVSKYKILQLVKEHSAVNADMAIRLAKFLGGTADSWLNMQRALDIWQLKQEKAKEYNKIRYIAGAVTSLSLLLYDSSLTKENIFYSRKNRIRVN